MLKQRGVIMLQQLQEHSFIKSTKPPAVAPESPWQKSPTLLPSCGGTSGASDVPQQCRNDGVYFLTVVDLHNTFVLLEAGRVQLVHQLFSARLLRLWSR